MQNLNDVGTLANAVVDYDRSVDQLSDAWASLHRTAHVLKTLQDVHMIQNCTAKSLGVCGKFRPGVRQDFFEIR